MKKTTEMVVNLTPHAITFVDSNGDIALTVEPSGTIARVTTETIVTGICVGIPVTETKFGEVENLPEPQEGVVYIVSSLVAQRCKGRDDVFIPNESVRDENGRIIGCKSQ